MKTLFSEFLYEEYIPNIDIEKYERGRNDILYKVEYTIEIDKGEVKIVGVIVSKYNDGIKYNGFEPAYFTGDYSEEYWDDNWEDIQKQIINYFESNF